jgi:hypothetical protein
MLRYEAVVIGKFLPFAVCCATLKTQPKISSEMSASIYECANQLSSQLANHLSRVLL